MAIPPAGPGRSEGEHLATSFVGGATRDGGSGDHCDRHHATNGARLLTFDAGMEKSARMLGVPLFEAAAPEPG